MKVKKLRDNEYNREKTSDMGGYLQKTAFLDLT